MELSDYTSLIEIAVTLNIAFVAIEYVKAYTRVLCNQAFKLDEVIRKEFSKLALVDEVTLNNISESTIDGKSIGKLIEESKREREKVSKEIMSGREELVSKIDDICEIKSLSSVSLWMFLYGIAALFFIGLKNFPEIGAELDLIWVCLTVLTILYALCGWLISDGRHRPLSDFSSLGHPILCWATSLVLSVIVAGVLSGILKIGDGVLSSNLKTMTAISGVTLMFSNFVVTIIKVWVKAGKIRDDIDAKCKSLKSKCDSLNENVKALIKVNEVSEKLNVDMTE